MGHNSEVLIGGNFQILPIAQQLYLATQAHNLLAKHPDTMLASLPTEIVDYMQGHGVMIVHPEHPDQLVAYARLHQWAGVNANGQTVFEFGSWIVSEDHLGQEYGKQVLFQTLELANQLDPQAQIIAVVEANNKKAQDILLQHGAIVIEKPSNVPCLLQDGNAIEVFLDLGAVAHKQQQWFLPGI